MTLDAEVIVVGLGVGGEFVAGRLAEAGLGVVGIESALVGGECPYWGCVPSKMIIRAANTLAEASRVGKLAGRATVQPDWAVVAGRIREEATDNWDDTVAVERFTGKGGRFVRGRATVTGSRTVVVDGQQFRASRGLVLATGTRPAVPPVDGLAGAPYWTNHEALEAKEAPASLTVAGGGAAGVELAQAFARFGTTVTIVEAADRLLPGEEPEAGELIGEVLRREGIRVLTHMRLRRVSHDGRDFTVHLDGAAPVRSERLLMATGRHACLKALGVAGAGIDDTRPFIAVDDHLRAGDGVWSVGDVTGVGAFTHVAMYQAGIAARDILGQAHQPASYRALPRVTFTDPEVGAVGLTEAQARGKDVTVRTAVSPIPSSSRGWIHGPGNDGFIKLIADTDAGMLIGATSAGPAGGEVLGALAVAVHARVPIAVLSQMIYAYPTFHRAIEDAIAQLSLRRAGPNHGPRHGSQGRAASVGLSPSPLIRMCGLPQAGPGFRPAGRPRLTSRKGPLLSHAAILPQVSAVRCQADRRHHCRHRVTDHQRRRRLRHGLAIGTGANVHHALRALTDEARPRPGDVRRTTNRVPRHQTAGQL